MVPLLHESRNQTKLEQERVKQAERKAAKADDNLLMAETRIYRLESAIDAGEPLPEPSVRRVIGVLDDNTLMLRPLFNDEKQVARLYGVVFPIQGQHRDSLIKFCFMKDAGVIDKGFDDDGQLLVDVLVDGRSLNRELIEAGLARYDSQNANDKILAHAEDIARKAQVGLWAAQ